MVLGRPPDADSIRINDHEFNCSPNLRIALQHLRSKDEEVTFWVDAACINQEDISEKNTQVRLMNLVYKQAKIVRVWLGEPFDGSGEAMMFIDDLQHWQADQKLSKHCQVITEALMNKVKLLTEFPWWQRVWVMQEVVLARSVDFHCGHDRFHWTWSMWRIMEFLPALVIDPTQCFKHDQLQGDIWDIVEILVHALKVFTRLLDLRGKDEVAFHRNDTVRILIEMSQLHTTDPRDHVYGALGLMPEFAKIQLVNYAFPVEAVFMLTTYFLCYYVRSLLPLASISGRSTSAPNRGWSLASWAMDLRRYPKKRKLFHWFTATGAWGPDNAFQIDFDVYSRCSKVRGTYFDRIVACHKVEGKVNVHFFQVETMRAYVQGWRDFLGVHDHGVGHSTYISGCSMEQAFRWTIVRGLLDTSGVYGDDRPLKSSDAETYFRWIASPASRSINSPDANGYSHQAAVPYQLALHRLMFDKNTFLFRTARGYMGLSVGVPDIAVEDEMYLMHRAEAPYALRPVTLSNGDRTFEVASECYVHGIMNGEAFRPTPNHDSHQARRHELRESLFGGSPTDQFLPVAPYQEIVLV
ncbi:hypothetical protein LTR64_005052 [Lithohypha guttulata]|uniref:uncharacterized protein n=1 Tax=Lithohypha guttulata TaxID=1690604 RepID=UPI002DDFF13C|nr:hypothetical protein LTR51_005113 [Lithohypha guttulata]